MKYLVFGEVLWDVYPDKKYIGGAPLNFAAHLSRHGEEVYLISSLGKDELGRETLEEIEGFGIKSDFVFFSPDKETGKCIVTLGEDFVPSYNLLQDVAWDYIPCNVTGSFDVLYFGTLALRNKENLNSLKKLINNRFEKIFVDVNLRAPFYSEKSVKFCFENANIIKISLEELPTVCSLLDVEKTDYKACAKLFANKYENISVVIITLGADGAYAFDARENKEYYSASPKVEVKSTVGAGDSFSASFLHHYLQGRDIETCMKCASRLASFVVSQYDAVPDYKIEEIM